MREFERCGLKQGSTYRFEVVILRIWEVVNGRKAKAKPSAASKKTDWEKNLAKLRSKERALDPQSPVKPVKTS